MTFKKTSKLNLTDFSLPDMSRGGEDVKKAHRAQRDAKSDPLELPGLNDGSDTKEWPDLPEDIIPDF
jgi:hypothetical protein